MTKALEAKKEAILKALRELHGDTSGPVQDNYEAIQEIIDEATDIKLMLEDDLPSK